MIRKIFFLTVILSGILIPALSQNGITIKPVKIAATEPNVIPSQFEGGLDSLNKYFEKNVKYPSLLIEIEMEGEVHARFAVTKDGAVKNVEILRGFDPLADNQIVAAIKKMPRWKPAKIASDNEAIDSYVELVIVFTLNDDLRNRIEEIRANEEADRLKRQELAEKGSYELTEEGSGEQSGKDGEEVDSLQNKVPEYPGGQQALDEYLKTNLKYPKLAIDMRVEGRVVFNLSVSKDGEITRIELYKGLHSECNEEAYYLVKKMPKWIPGLKDGEPAAMQVILPIPFVLPR